MEATYDKRIFGERLRAALNDKSLTQAEAARWLEVDQTSVSAWCRGSSDINLSKAVELARWLGVSLDWLVGLSDDRDETLSPQDHKVLTLARLVEKVGWEEAFRQSQGANEGQSRVRSIPVTRSKVLYPRKIGGPKDKK